MGDNIDSSEDEDEVRVIGSHSPTETTVLHGNRSPSKGPIRLKPLSALIGSPPVIGEGKDEIEDIDSPEIIMSQEEVAVSFSNPNWRSSCSGVRKKLRFILNHQNAYQDVTFVVGRTAKETLSGHKLILRLGSPVLDKVFSGLDAVGVTVVENGDIIVPEVEPFAFRHLLQYIYTDEYDPTGLISSDIMAILQAAKLFEVSDLVRSCVQALKDNISDENAVVLCDLAGDIEDFELRDLAILHICRNAKNILPSTSFLDLTYPNLLLLVVNDDLEMDELLLFHSVLRWAKEQCRRKKLDATSDSIREILDEILYQIRFPLMSPPEFTFEVIPTKVLSSDEQVEIFKCLCLPESMREQLEPTSFICKRRNHTKIKSEPGIKDEESGDTITEKFKSNNPVESPPCQATLAAHLNEITETESEDTSSQVSSIRSHSSSNVTPSKKRPRMKSPSPSCSKAQKSSTKTPTSSHTKPGKTKKRKSIDLEKEIHVQDCEIDFNQFIQECSTNPRRKDIESIRLSRVIIRDHDKLQDGRARLPKLKEFHLDIKIPSLKHGDVNNFAGELNLKHFFFFSIKVGDLNWALDNIWTVGINLSLVVNGITLFKIDHSRKSLIINKLKEASTILSSTSGETGVKSLVLSHQKFPDRADLFPSQSLERLVLLSINHIPEVNTFLKRFKRLRELCLLSTETKKIDLCNDLVSERLRKLAVGTAKFSFPLPAALKSLEELFLWRCEWSTGFEDNFNRLFPNLKKVSFFGCKTTAKLLKKILKIKSIEEIGCGSFDWSTESDDHNEIKDIILTSGLPEKVNSFVLTKTDEGFEGKKGSFDLSQEEIYKNFQFYHLYVNYEGFRG